MRRLLILTAALVLVALPALAQEAPPPNRTTQADKPDVRRIPLIPLENLRGYDLYRINEDPVSDTLSEAQILRRISRIYTYQADALAAQANGDAEHAEGLIELAMAEVATLTQQPDITERPRFRELYRTIVTEYERYFGVPDTMLAMPYGEIFQLRAEMFAMMEDIEEPLLEDVMLPEIEPMVTHVPMTINRVVERTIDYFVTNKRDLLKRWMARADTYFPMVEQVFREEGVPDELKYLALVESGLNPRAQSWARAVGMWQFVSATGRAYGLDVSPWVDERMDPEKATRAAARHLRDLYAQYGDNWHVALAGYNCSPRCIKRAIARAGGTVENPPSYWDMYRYLPRETRGYVPQFIAFAIIMSHPEAFGFDDVPKGPRYEYEQVPVLGMLSLDDVASMAGSDAATIRALNPELRRATLPPTKTPYMLRLPVGSYERFAGAFENLPETAKQPVGEYVVRRGDSLGKIASRYGVSVSELRHANGLRGSLIHPGQRLIVPVPDYTGEIALGDAQPATVRYGVRTVRPIQPLGDVALASSQTPVVKASASGPSASDAPAEDKEEKATAEEPEAEDNAEKEEPATRETRVVYRVRRGDTLSRIASKYGVSVRDIQSWNDLRGTRIQSGQRLYLYTSGSQPERVVYRVRRGDNLTEIASRYGVTVQSIKSWNDLRRSTIYPGQRLTIHPGQSAPKYVIHKVRRGDNLTDIARRYGVTVRQIKNWNNLRRSTIYPGQRLKIFS